MKSTYNVKHCGENQVVVVWLKDKMKCLLVMDMCKVVVDMNVVMGTNILAGGKDMVAVGKYMVP